MLLSLTYQLIRFITDLVLVRIRSDAQLCAEVLALRHQLRLLERKVGKPALQRRIASCWLASAACSRSPACHLCYRSRRRCSAGIAIWSATSGLPSASAHNADVQCATPSGGR